MYVIVGAGWYGCRIAEILDSLNVKYVITDKTKSFFSGSSSKNQNRLHLGFHYPRCKKTRDECVAGFKNFVDKKYPYESFFNVYAISKLSLIDAQTYLGIYEHDKINYAQINHDEITLRTGLQLNTSMFYPEMVLCDEKYINFYKCKLHFEEKFRSKLETDGNLDISNFDNPLYNGKPVIHVFDCTYGNLISPNEKHNVEVCCSAIYKYKENCLFSFTIMDGSFFSIYPYEPDKQLFTLTHVKYTPVKVYESHEEASEYIDSDKCSIDCQNAIHAMECDVIEYMPNFRSLFEYVDCFVSKKTKFIDNGSDDRSVRIYTNDKTTSIIGGKITGIFDRSLENQVVDTVMRASSTPDFLHGV